MSSSMTASETKSGTYTVLLGKGVGSGNGGGGGWEWKGGGSSDGLDMVEGKEEDFCEKKNDRPGNFERMGPRQNISATTYSGSGGW